ncbi:unnamed protein product, partial [marine sediment metagenome]
MWLFLKIIHIYDDNLPIKQEKLRKNEKRRDDLEEDLDKIKKNRLETQEKLNLERKQLKDNEDFLLLMFVEFLVILYFLIQ